jgi:hypothetical protein
MKRVDGPCEPARWVRIPSERGASPWSLVLNRQVAAQYLRAASRSSHAWQREFLRRTAAELILPRGLAGGRSSTERAAGQD